MANPRGMSRTTAFQLIFQRLSIGFQREGEATLLTKLADSENGRQFASSLLERAWDERKSIEARIDELSTSNRKRSQVLSALLFVAVAELLYFPETPPKVVINECIELCKKYCADNSAGYCNSLLDKMMKTSRPA